MNIQRENLFEVESNNGNINLVNISRIMSDYYTTSCIAAFVIDIDKNQQIPYALEGKFCDMNSIRVEDYPKPIMGFIDASVHPEDKALIKHLISEDNLRNGLSKLSSFSQVFREVSDGSCSFTKLQAVKGRDDNLILLIFTNVSDEYLANNSHDNC